MTPLMQDIEKLQYQVQSIRGRQLLDSLDSLAHVRIMGIFLQIYRDREIADQIQAMQEGRAVINGEYI